jgi:poly-gamma-glutamate synthesis protein (capsule biosynthesis protein)
MRTAMQRAAVIGSLLAALAAPRAAAEESITLALGGDAMLARLVDRAVAAWGARYPWGDVRGLLRAADLALVNLECSIALAGEKFPGRVFYFRARPHAVDSLLEAGIDYVSLANNHALDYQAPALLETVRRLDAAKIAHAGAGATRAQAEQPALLEARGIRVGVVSFADHYREYAATQERPGTNVIAIDPEGPDFLRVRRALGRARAAGAHLVVFSIHWGPNMRERPPKHFRQFARAVMDAGADIFHGHSAHVFQAVEVYRGRPILYDTGDLVDDYAVDAELRNDLQLLFLLRSTARGVTSLELVPLRIARMQVNLATGDDLAFIHARMRRLSQEAGTRLEQRGDRLFVRIRQ